MHILYIPNENVWPRHFQYSGEIDAVEIFSDQESKGMDHVRVASEPSLV